MTTTTCAECVAYRVGGWLCKELRDEGTCQKMCAERMHTLDVVVQLVALAVEHSAHKKQIQEIIYQISVQRQGDKTDESEQREQREQAV